LAEEEMVIIFNLGHGIFAWNTRRRMFRQWLFLLKGFILSNRVIEKASGINRLKG